VKKKVVLVFLIVFGVFFIFAGRASASCQFVDQSATSCPTSSYGLCITGGGKTCCSDEESCMTSDNTASWIAPTSSQTQTSTTTSDVCKNLASGDCTDPSLPQACSVSMSYDCCNTEQACYDLPGVPVPHANPSQQSAPLASTSDDKDILCGCTGITCTGVNTAIGCVHALGDESVFLKELLGWAMGIGGGIAFILMLYSGFMIMTSSGDPERLKAGQELLTSAISGLILLIFSVFILKFIGIDILGLCKFGFGAKC